MKLNKNSRTYNKLYFFNFLILIIVFTLQVVDASATMTREEAKQVLINRVIAGDPNEEKLMAFGPQNISVAGDVVAPFIIGKQPFPGISRIIEKDTWFFWINDETNCFFAHLTRFVYIDANHTNPVIGDGIIIDEAGWWPQINGVDHYRYNSDRSEDSADWIYGQAPEPPQQEEVISENIKNLSNFSENGNASNSFAIIIGSDSSSLVETSMNNFQSAIANSVTGPGIPTGNIIWDSSCPYSDFVGHINTMNSNNAENLYVFMVMHGDQQGAVLDGEWHSNEDIADAIGQSTATNVNVVTESCYDGALVDELQETGVVDTLVTATDGEHPAHGWDFVVYTIGGSFSKKLSDFWQDGTDTTTLEEAYEKVIYEECAWWDIICKEVKEQGPTINHSGPGIPSLSEWKRIFLILFLISSSFAFIRYREHSLASATLIGESLSGKQWGKAIFENGNRRSIAKWHVRAIIAGTILVGIFYREITFLDVIGILVCSPFLAYIMQVLLLEHRAVKQNMV